MPDNILQGDALARLRELADASVHCCVTSPPYYGLRDYAIPDQIGLEDSPDEYVDNLRMVFREVRRVLVPGGTLWLNLGDSYAGAGYANHAISERSRLAAQDKETHGQWLRRTRGSLREMGIKDKDLMGIPWLVAQALRADGWWLRADIIWAKGLSGENLEGGGMPGSAGDRPVVSHEHVFLLAKSRNYHVGHLTEPRREGSGTRIMRTVWQVTPQPGNGNHGAPMPRRLADMCIRGGTSDHGHCPACGAPWSDAGRGCECPDTVAVPAVVLDPFAGSGTTLVVAKRLRRDFVGIELNPDYISMIRENVRNALEEETQRVNFDLFMAAV